MIDSLPPRKLTRSEIEQIRNQDDVINFCSLGSHDLEETSGLLIGLYSGKIVAIRLAGRERRGWQIVEKGSLQDAESVREVIEALFATTTAHSEYPEREERAVSAFHRTAMQWREDL